LFAPRRFFKKVGQVIELAKVLRIPQGRSAGLGAAHDGAMIQARPISGP
jgi:hypothetical protein